jgi:hypothetical protein
VDFARSLPYVSLLALLAAAPLALTACGGGGDSGSGPAPSSGTAPTTTQTDPTQTDPPLPPADPGPASTPAPEPDPGPSPLPAAAHPRLLFGPEDLDDLRARRATTHAEIWGEVLADAQGYQAPAASYGGDGARYGERLATLALVALVDPAASARDGTPIPERLLAYVDAMRGYPEWFDAYPFGDDRTTSNYLMALALAYDWHQELLGEARRDALRAHQLERATAWSGASRWLQLEDHLGPDGSLTWDYRPKALGNHATRNYLGIAAVAHALAPEADTDALLARLQTWRQLVLEQLPSDGADTECAYYHPAGLRDLLLWLHVHDRAYGTDSVTTHPFFAGSVRYDRHMILPGGTDDYGGCLNFGDSYAAHGESVRVLGARLGALLGDGTAQWLATELSQPDALTWVSYLWFDPTVAAVDPRETPTHHHFPERGLFTWRSSWEDDAVTFAIKCGSQMGGHDQPDAGGFLLYRAGVPYLTDYGYTDYCTSDEQNLLLVNGEGQHLEGLRSQEPIDPALWGSLTVHLAHEDFFDLTADPTRMYPSHQAGVLQSWTREVLGFGPGLFLIRDLTQASQPVTVESLLHSYFTEAFSGGGPDTQYVIRLPWEDDPWSDQGGGRFLAAPRDGAEPLRVFDASPAAHPARIEPSSFVPHKLPDGSSNATGQSLVLGTRLVRTSVGSETASVLALGFDPALVAEALPATVDASGVRVVDTRLAGIDPAVIVAVWTEAGSGALGGLTVQGDLGGRRRDAPATFGRGLTQLDDAGGPLLVSTRPVDLFARLEHVATADSPRFARVRVNAPAGEVASVSLRCPTAPKAVQVAGRALPFVHQDGLLSVDLPGGDALTVDLLD